MSREPDAGIACALLAGDEAELKTGPESEASHSKAELVSHPH